MGGENVSYNQKFFSNPSFPNLANSKASQFMFPKYLIDHQNVKIVKSKFSKKSNKNKHKSNLVLKESEKKREN